MLWWRLEEEILEMSRWMGIQSNALERSREATTVRDGGGFWLKPLAMGVEILSKEDVVEWSFLKPCCEG